MSAMPMPRDRGHVRGSSVCDASADHGRPSGRPVALFSVRPIPSYVPLRVVSLGRVVERGAHRERLDGGL